MIRRRVAFAVIAAVLGLIVFDGADSAPLNPYQAPPTFALGSGEAASGAHCAAVPGT